MTDHQHLDGLSKAQKAFIVALTDQRIANLMEASDYIADMKPEAKEFLRNADKKTLKWLERASPEDIGQLQYSIRFMAASKLLGRVAWISIAAFFGAIVTMLTLWEKFASIWSGVKK